MRVVCEGMNCTVHMYRMTSKDNKYYVSRLCSAVETQTPAAHNCGDNTDTNFIPAVGESGVVSNFSPPSLPCPRQHSNNKQFRLYDVTRNVCIETATPMTVPQEQEEK